MVILLVWLYLQVPTSLPGVQHVALNCVGDKKAPGCIISTHPSFLSKEAQAKEAINSWHDRIEKPWKYLLHECCTTIFRVSPYSLAMLSITACFVIGRHLVLFREFFRQLLPEAPPPSNTPSNSRIPYIRQTTVECFQHINTRPVARQRLVRQRAEGGLVGGAGGRGRTKSISQQTTIDDGMEDLP